MALRICIVGDVALHRDNLAAALGSLDGIDVSGVFGHVDGTPRLIASLSPSPDVILIDVPLKDCHALVQATERVVPDARLVALGVDERESDILACAAEGMAGFLPREASLDDLVRMIHGVVRNELPCSPTIAATLFRRVAMAASSVIEPPGPLLTSREREVLELIREGLANKEIAGQLRIAEGTVKNHVHHLLEKLQVKRRMQAAGLRASAAFSSPQRLKPPA